LQTLDPHLGSGALALLRTAPPAPPPPPEAVLAQLAAELLERAHRDLILVLDDYHVITNEALQRAVAALLEHSPLHLHLVIATRVDPALPLARLRARIAAAKRAELLVVNGLLADARAKLVGGAGSAGRVADLVAWRALTLGVREWPVDAGTLARSALFVLLGLGSWLGGAVVDRLLDAALR